MPALARCNCVRQSQIRVQAGVQRPTKSRATQQEPKSVLRLLCPKVGLDAVLVDLMERLAYFNSSFGRPMHVRPCGATHQHVVETRASMRALSNAYASLSDRCLTTEMVPYRSRARKLQVAAALFEPPPFQPSKLSVQYIAGAYSSNGSRGWKSFPATRRYTLTHNDVTGALMLSIGSDYNQRQVQGFYTRILRDEITAEWYFNHEAIAPAELHIYCHVSGEERWLAPPQLRNFIFRREMTLVLDTFAYADKEFLQSFTELKQAKVFVHFQSDVQDLDLREYWGVLGDRRTWRRMPKGILTRLKLLLFGFPALPHQWPRTTLTTLQQLQEEQQQQQQQQQQTVCNERQQQQGTVTPAAAAADAAVQVAAAAAAAGDGVLQGTQQQQQPWHPLAEAAVEATRPVVSSLQEFRRQHPGAQQPVWQDVQQQQQQAELEQHQPCMAVAAVANDHSSSRCAGSCGASQQQGDQLQSASNSRSSSNGSVSWQQYSMTGTAAAAAVASSSGNGTSQPTSSSSLAHDEQVQVLPAPPASDSVEVLQEYGYWFRPGHQQQQQLLQQEQCSLALCNTGSSNSTGSSSSSVSIAGSNILPIVVLNDSWQQRQLTLQPQQQQAPDRWSAGAIVASSSSALCHSKKAV